MGLPEPASVDAHKKVFDALRQMGFRETEAKQAMQVAREEVGASAELEVLLRSALRATTERAV